MMPKSMDFNGFQYIFIDFKWIWMDLDLDLDGFGWIWMDLHPQLGFDGSCLARSKNVPSTITISDSAKASAATTSAEHSIQFRTATSQGGAFSGDPEKGVSDSPCLVRLGCLVSRTLV